MKEGNVDEPEMLGEENEDGEDFILRGINTLLAKFRFPEVIRWMWVKVKYESGEATEAE